MSLLDHIKQRNKEMCEMKCSHDLARECEPGPTPDDDLLVDDDDLI